MARSLLEGADLRALRDVSAGGAPAALAAALIDTGLLQFDPDDLEWEGRDRLFVSGDSVARAVTRRLTAAGAEAEAVAVRLDSGGDAIAQAFGAAVASQADGGAWRAWCVLDADACDDGRVWEAARAAAEVRAEMLGVLVAGNATAPLWRACGWRVHEAPAADTAWLVAALDHVVAEAPAVLLAVDDG